MNISFIMHITNMKSAANIPIDLGHGTTVQKFPLSRRPNAVTFLVFKQYHSTLKYLRYYSKHCMRLIDLLPQACQNMIKVYGLFTKLNLNFHVGLFFHLFMHDEIMYYYI